ncbi:MAG: WYL domain-containing protein [Actinobacteria bacterium]|nr:WYL domain-containing protein [Actinomycetota bacterium]
MSDQSTAGRLGQRLGRILLMLPYAIQNPGVSVTELSHRFGVAKRDVIDDLNLVFLCGLPGYGPGDLIDVSIDEDRIYIDMADYFSAPLRLTPGEALSLYAGATALAELPDLANAGSLKSALDKLGKALGVDGDAARIGVRFEPAPVQHLATLRDALSRKRRVRLEYLSATRGELTEREVDPWGLIAALGRWYLVARDRLSGEERMFRLDRMKVAEITSDAAEVPEDFDAERYKGAFTGEGETSVTLEISPAAARWFEDYYPVENSYELDDGWRKVTMIAGGDRWMATLMLQLGSDCRNPEPESLQQRARALAAAIEARHR